jgi:hypothetical protein
MLPKNRNKEYLKYGIMGGDSYFTVFSFGVELG